MKNNNVKCDSPEAAMKVLKVIGMVLLGIAAAFAIGLIIMLLWNWLMPMIFGLTELNYWQSIGVLALASILFGRFGGSSSENKKDNKTDKNSIKGKIKEEIKKEFEKEYEKKEDKKTNVEYEDMYEEWWEAEGETYFEKYVKSSVDK